MSQKIIYIMSICFVLLLVKTKVFLCNMQQRSKTKQPIKICKIDKSKPITVFIHGTLFGPPISSLVHAFDCPRGFTPAKKQGNKYIHGCIGYILSQADPKEFELDRFYLFGWAGFLSYEARLEAARELYNFLVTYKSPLRIIAHSHGGNVALLLAKVAQEKKDVTFSIDFLVLLGTPVQVATACYIKAPIFKNIVSFYSSADIIQIADLQKLHACSNKNTPLFSQRIFDLAPEILQVRVKFGRYSLSHMDFITMRFLKRLPALLKHINKHKKYKHIVTTIEEYRGKRAATFDCRKITS